MRWLDGITDTKDMSLSKLRENSEGQGSLECCNAWGCKELATTQQLNNNRQIVSLKKMVAVQKTGFLLQEVISPTVRRAKDLKNH